MKWRNVGGSHTQLDADGVERTYQKNDVFESDTDFSKRPDMADKFMRMPDDAKVKQSSRAGGTEVSTKPKPKPVAPGPDPLDSMSDADLRKAALELEIQLQDGVEYERQSLIDAIRASQNA